MSPAEFAYWLKGIAVSQMPVGDMGSLVLRQAAEVLDHVIAHRGPAKIPAMKQVRVPDFCSHNVHMGEVCAACVSLVQALRLSMPCRFPIIPLPAGTRVVYINPDASGTIQEPALELNHSAGAGDEKEPALAASQVGEGSALGLKAQ